MELACVNNLFAMLAYVTYSWFYSTSTRVTFGQQTLGLQDGISYISKGEETHGCQNREAAKLETDVGFYP